MQRILSVKFSWLEMKQHIVDIRDGVAVLPVA